MRKFLVAVLASAALFAMAGKSQAVSVFVTVTPDTTVAANDWVNNGVATSNTLITSFFTENNPGGTTQYDPPYPTVVNYGTGVQVDTPGTSGTFGPNAPAWYDVAITVSGSAMTYNIRVEGLLNGSIDPNSSQALYKIDKLFNLDTATDIPFVTEPNPINAGLTAYRIDLPFTDVGGSVRQWFNAFQTLGKVGEAPDSYAGATQFTSAVPEPGTLAMLLGTGVSGSLFMLRRRRA